MSEPFAIQINTEADRNKAFRWLKACPLGWIVLFEAERRSALQNSKFHAMIGDIRKARGGLWAGKVRSLEDWKRILVNQFESELGVQTDIVPSLDSERVVVLGSQTREFGKKKAAAFVEYLYALGGSPEWKVVWSEPAMAAYYELRKAAA